MKPSNKTALIAFAINAVLTYFMVNTFGVIASGIYLGLAKEKDKSTNIIFFVLSFILFAVLDITVSPTIYEDPYKQVFVFLLSNTLMAMAPLGVAFIVKKLAKK